MFVILLLLLEVTVLTLVGTFVYTGLRYATWVPTKNKDVDRFLALAKIKPGQKMYDLGCGDARLLCAAASTGAHAYGLEISLLPFLLAHLRTRFSPDKKNITISYKNIWNENLRDADIVYIWLMPNILQKLEKKLIKELKPGTKIIAYMWPIKQWKPVAIDMGDAPKEHPLFLYER